MKWNESESGWVLDWIGVLSLVYFVCSALNIIYQLIVINGTTAIKPSSRLFCILLFVFIKLCHFVDVFEVSFHIILCYPRFIWRLVWVSLPPAMRVPFVYVKNCMFSRLKFFGVVRLCLYMCVVSWTKWIKKAKILHTDWINKMPNNFILCTGHLLKLKQSCCRFYYF